MSLGRIPCLCRWAGLDRVMRSFQMHPGEGLHLRDTFLSNCPRIQHLAVLASSNNHIQARWPALGHYGRGLWTLWTNFSKFFIPYCLHFFSSARLNKCPHILCSHFIPYCFHFFFPLHVWTSVHIFCAVIMHSLFLFCFSSWSSVITYLEDEISSKEGEVWLI